MQDPQEIRQFTKRYATLSDPPWLAIAIWVTLAPAANQFGYLSASAELVSFLIAGAVALVLSRLYRRRYGVVVQQEPKPWFLRPVTIAGLVIGAQAVSLWLRLPVDLGLVAGGLLFAAAAFHDGGIRRHLLAPAIVLVAAAFRSFLIEDWQAGNAAILIAFGMAWAFVCLWDYRVLNRSLMKVHRVH